MNTNIAALIADNPTVDLAGIVSADAVNTDAATAAEKTRAVQAAQRAFTNDIIVPALQEGKVRGVSLTTLYYAETAGDNDNKIEADTTYYYKVSISGSYEEGDITVTGETITEAEYNTVEISDTVGTVFYNSTKHDFALNFTDEDGNEVTLSKKSSDQSTAAHAGRGISAWVNKYTGGFAGNKYYESSGTVSEKGAETSENQEWAFTLKTDADYVLHEMTFTRGGEIEGGEDVPKDSNQSPSNPTPANENAAQQPEKQHR